MLDLADKKRKTARKLHKEQAEKIDSLLQQETGVFPKFVSAPPDFKSDYEKELARRRREHPPEADKDTIEALRFG
jgi:hypothetical protein